MWTQRSRRLTRAWQKWARSRSEQLCKFFDCELQVFDNSAQRLSLDCHATVHRDHDSRMIRGPHVDGMTTRLSSELKTQKLSDAGYLFTGNDG